VSSTLHKMGHPSGRRKGKPCASSPRGWPLDRSKALCYPGGGLNKPKGGKDMSLGRAAVKLAGLAAMVPLAGYGSTTTPPL